MCFVFVNKLFGYLLLMVWYLYMLYCDMYFEYYCDEDLIVLGVDFEMNYVMCECWVWLLCWCWVLMVVCKIFIGCIVVGLLFVIVVMFGDVFVVFWCGDFCYLLMWVMYVVCVVVLFVGL